MIRLVIAFFMFFVISGHSFSQEKTRFLVSLDSKRSFFSEAKIKTIGAKIGFKYGCKFNVGVGIFVANKIEFDYRLDPFRYPDASTTTISKISYVTTFVEPIILSEKKKMFSVPISFGGGYIQSKYRKLNSFRTKKYFTAFVPLLEVSGQAMVRLIPYVWIGFGIGYRHFFYSKSDYVNTFFNTPFYVLKLKIGRPCKEAGFFYKWRKNTFGKKKK